MVKNTGYVKTGEIYSHNFQKMRGFNNNLQQNLASQAAARL